MGCAFIYFFSSSPVGVGQARGKESGVRRRAGLELKRFVPFRKEKHFALNDKICLLYTIKVKVG